MKKNEFIDDEERDLVESYEKWEFVSAKNLEQRKKSLKDVFKSTTSKRRPINVRLLESDLIKIKSKAIEEWLPYQTFISQILHKYTSGKLISKK